MNVESDNRTDHYIEFCKTTEPTDYKWIRNLTGGIG